MQEPGSNPLPSSNDDSLSVDIQRMSLESAIRQAAEAIVITSATGKIQYVNPAFTRMTGYRQDEVIGHYPNVLKSGNQDPVYYEDLWTTILAGKVWRGELLNRRKDGTVYTEEMSITPVRSAAGRTTNYIAIKQDVTERKAAEADRQFLAAIVSSTDDAVVGSTLDGRILTWNRGAEKLYGYRAEEAIGHSILILLDPEFHDQCRRISEALIRGRTFPRFECRATRQSGEGIVVSVSVSLVRNAAGEATGSAAIIRDITAARHAQWAVRDNEARYRRALESGPDGIGIITLDSRILYANETLCRMLGYSSEELYAIGWWNIIHPEDREVLSQMYQQMPVGQQAILESEKRYVHKLGHTVSASLRVTRIDFEDSCEFVVYVSETGNIAEGAFCAAGTFER